MDASLITFSNLSRDIVINLPRAVLEASSSYVLNLDSICKVAKGSVRSFPTFETVSQYYWRFGVQYTKTSCCLRGHQWLVRMCQTIRYLMKLLAVSYDTKCPRSPSDICFPFISLILFDINGSFFLNDRLICQVFIYTKGSPKYYSKVLRLIEVQKLNLCFNCQKNITV